MKARLDHPDPPDGELDGFAWPLRFSDFDVLGHVNNAACWQIVEEALSATARPASAPARRGPAPHRHRARRRRSRCARCDDDDGAAALGAGRRRSIAVTARGGDRDVALLDQRVVEGAVVVVGR